MLFYNVVPKQKKKALTLCCLGQSIKIRGVFSGPGLSHNLTNFRKINQRSKMAGLGTSENTSLMAKKS